MWLDQPDVSLTLLDIGSIEADIGLRLPDVVREQYVEANGGTPTACVFDDGATLDTVVSFVLPLRTGRGAGTAPDAYRRLVLEKGLVPKQFFPFAVDGGGDYFFVDTTTAMVSFYRSDDALGKRLLNLGVSFREFWDKLQLE